MRWTIFTAAFIVCGASVAAAQTGGKPLQACALLTQSDISAFGGTGQGQDTEQVITEGFGKGQKMHMCVWKSPTQGHFGSVSVAATPGTKNVNREAELARMTATLQPLKAQGWTDERKDFGSTVCVAFTPPPSLKDMPLSMGCFAVAKSTGISVGVNGRTKVPLDRLNALLDKAIARLP
jgi:hypothetical protein